MAVIPAAIVNIVTKSGTNDFHGSAYVLAKRQLLASSGAKNEFRNNNFGGVLGGPIVKNRTFFFGGYEGQREFVFLRRSYACRPPPI
jgi:hypothetical protein